MTNEATIPADSGSQTPNAGNPLTPHWKRTIITPKGFLKRFSRAPALGLEPEREASVFRGTKIFRLGLFLMAATMLVAQVIITSTILGTVTDPHGAVVPGAKVTLRNVDTGAEHQADTDVSGSYRFGNLIAGHYVVEVNHPGFARAVSTTINLENGTTQRVNVALIIGQVAERVEVSAAASLLQMDDANVSATISQKFVNDLPSEGRNYLNLPQILPNFNSGTGDTSRFAWSLAGSTMANGAAVYNVGGTEYGVGYYIDGLNNNDNWMEGPVMNVNQDSIQEVKADVSNYSAEYGRDVGQLNVTTKSGTNELHGTAYDTLQNAGMNANNAWSNFQGIGRNPYHQNQYGFTAGGPVYIPKLFNGKNKMFFFTSFEQLRNRGLNQYSTYVPTDAERNGDWSDWLKRFPVNPATCDGSETAPINCRYVIYNPTTYNPDTGLRQPYANNIITNASPIALKYLSHFPQPNGYVSPDPNNLNNYLVTSTSGLDANNYTARIDYNLTSRDTVYFRYLHDSGQAVGGEGLVPDVWLGNGIRKTDTYQGHYVRTFSPTFTNELNLSWTYAHNTSLDPARVAAFGTSWLPGLFQNAAANPDGLTSEDKSLLGIKNDVVFGVNIGGTLGDESLGAGEYFYLDVPIFQVSDNVTKVLGAHTLKFGFYMSRRKEHDNDIIRTVDFYGNYTSLGPNSSDGSGFNGIAEFQTGFVSDMTQRQPATGGDTSLNYSFAEYAAFVNDSWNVTPKLTLNLGLRYDIVPPPYSVDHFWATLDTNYPGYRLVMPGITQGFSSQPYSAQNKDFAPRIGLAYRLGSNTVIRSGYGMFYETGRHSWFGTSFSVPAYAGTTYDSTNQDDPAMTKYTLDQVWPAAITTVKGTFPVPLGENGGIICERCSASFLDYNKQLTPYTQRWSLDVERALGKSVVAKIGYLGSRGTHLYSFNRDLNLPPEGRYFNDEEYYQARPLTQIAPGRWEDITTVVTDRSNNYHALSAELQTRAWHGLTSRLAYTWSKQMDNAFGEQMDIHTGHVLGGQWHPDWSYGPSDANHTHRLTAAFTYQLPGESMANRWLKTAIGGWQLSGIATFETGTPFTVWNGYTSSYDHMGDVPFRTCNGNLSRSDRTPFRYFDTGCFTEPAASTDPQYTDQGINNLAVSRGNESRNVLTGPGINNWDMGLQKAFALRSETRRLVFRADAFNVFNHTQWSGVNNYDDRLNNPQSEFGWVTGARPARRMQLNMRFVF